MNAFAISIFTILFSWLRSLVESLWHASASGSFSGLMTWLGDHWIIVTAVLCVICTILDYLVWLIRWKPYVIWRQKITKRLGRSPQKSADENDFDRGYLGGVDLKVPERVPAAAAVWDEPFYEQPFSAPQPQPVESPLDPVAYAPVDQEIPNEEVRVSQPQIYPAAPMPSEVPTIPAAFGGSHNYFPENSAAQPAMRHRRSDRHSRKSPSLPEKLLAAEDEKDILLNGLPPIINSSEAFHQPVYPETKTQSPWLQTRDKNRNG